MGKMGIAGLLSNPRMLVIWFLGFSGGIPLALTTSTLQAWMTKEGVDLKTIGLFSLVGLPYTLKFFWAPFMDRYVPPFLGRRRGWMVICQLALVCAITALAFSHQAANAPWVACLAVCVAFFSASQDVVIDAYITEALEPAELGFGSGNYIMGYRIAMLVSGALALILAGSLPWRTVYLIMACTMLIGVVTACLAPEPLVRQKPPRTIGDAVVKPFMEYFSRKGAFEMLLFIIIYKVGDVMTNALVTPFLLQQGFTTPEIGAVNKGFGMVATILGALAGGAVMSNLGIARALLVFGIFQGGSNIMYMFLAMAGHSYPMMVSAITIEHLCAGMSTAAFSAFIMSLCDKRFTATQYALLSSLMAVARVIVSAPSGFLVVALGWQTYFLFTTCLALPGLLLLSRFSTWHRPGVVPVADGAVARG